MIHKEFLSFIKMTSLKLIKTLGEYIIVALIVLAITCLPLLVIGGIEVGVSHFSNKKVKLTDKERAEGVLIDAPDRGKYDKYDYEHWGDCISATPKDGWKPMPFSQKYNNLEEGRTYGLILTFGKVLGVNDGVNIDEFRVTFVPTSTEGTADFTFYTNPEWVKSGTYGFYVELDDYK